MLRSPIHTLTQPSRHLVQASNFHNAVSERHDNHQGNQTAWYTSADEVLHAQVALAGSVFLHNCGYATLVVAQSEGGWLHKLTHIGEATGRQTHRSTAH